MSEHRIFLTGATGFVGSHVAHQLLLAGLEVHALCRNPPTDVSSIHWHVGDLTTPSSLETALAAAHPHTIIHCAAYGIRHHEQSSQQLININIQGTLSLMELASQYGVKRWIQTGSCAEYPSQQEPLSEKDLPEPPNLYGVTKAASTLLALQQGALLRLPTTVLRLFHVYGPGEAPQRLIPALLSSCFSEQPTPFTSGSKIRDFVYVEDVAALYVALAMTPHFPDGEIFNIGTGISTTLQEVGAVVESLIGKLGYFHWGKIPNRPQEHLSLVADITKSRKILQWSPKTSLKEGLAKILNRNYHGTECLK
jgi:nucleoside-diphosphate-sugar epimerase